MLRIFLDRLEWRFVLSTEEDLEASAADSAAHTPRVAPQPSV